MRKDDIIGIAGNHWNGYSKGVNKRTRQNGLFPSYKAEDVVELADCPTYEEVRLDPPAPPVVSAEAVLPNEDTDHIYKSPHNRVT